MFQFFCAAIDPRYAGIFAAHDNLYLTHVMSRKDADIFLRKELIKAGFCPVKAWIIYFAVRAFGKPHYDLNNLL